MASTTDRTPRRALAIDMTWSCSSAHPGPGRGPRRRSSRSASVSRSWLPATSCGPPSRRDAARARGATGTWSRGQLVPDDTIVRDVPRPARARTSAAARSSTASRATGPRQRRSTRRSPKPDARVDAAVYIDVPIEDLVERMADAGSARPPATSTTRHQPAAGRRASATSTARRSIQRDETRNRHGPGPAAQQVAAAARRRRPLPVARASCGRSTAAADIDERHDGARSPRSTAGRDGLTWSPASRAPRSSGCAVPDASWPRSWPSSRASSSRASRRPSSTAWPRRTSASPAPIPSFKGYPGINPRRPFPASVCISIDDEIVHGIPGERTHPHRPDRVDRRRGDRRRLARRSARGRSTSASRRPRSADLIDTTRLALPGRDRRGACPATTSRTSRPRSRTWPRRAGYGIVRQFVGHGIGTAMHEEPQVPNFRTGRPGRKLESGLCLAIEPMFTLGRAEARASSTDDWTVVTRTARWPRTSRTRSPSPSTDPRS